MQTLSFGDITAITVPQVLADLTGNIVVSFGPQANMPYLSFGQMYFAKDSNKLYFGTPGVGTGYIQIGDTTGMNETLLQLLAEIRSVRLAIVKLACDGGQANPRDFDPQVLATDSEIGIDTI